MLLAHDTHGVNNPTLCPAAKIPRAGLSHGDIGRPCHATMGDGLTHRTICRTDARTCGLRLAVDRPIRPA